MDLYEIIWQLTKVAEKNESVLRSFKDFEKQFIADNNEELLYPIHIGMVVMETQQIELKSIINGLDRCILELRKQGEIQEKTEQI